MPEHPSIEQLERRVKADPLSIAFAALAEEYRRAGRYEEAIEICRTGLTRHPAYVSARVTLGRALVAAGQLGEAAQELEGVLRTAPENLAAIRALAEIHQRRGSQHAAELGSEELEPQPQVPQPSPPPPAEPETVALVDERVPAPPASPSREQLIIARLEHFLAGALALRCTRAAGYVGP